MTIFTFINSQFALTQNRIVNPAVTRFELKISPGSTVWSWMEQLIWACVSGTLGLIPSVLWVGRFATCWRDSPSQHVFRQRNTNLWWLNPAFPVTHYPIKGLVAGPLFKVSNDLCKSSALCWRKHSVDFTLALARGLVFSMKAGKKSESLGHRANLYRAP